MTKILLIRHALTDSVGKRLSGRTPGISLNNEGRNQAKKLAERLSGLPIRAIYSSPLERALETADPLAQTLNLNCVTEDSLQEIDFGDWTNRTFEEIKKDILFEQFNAFRSATRIPGGEMMAEAQTRIISKLENLRTKHPQETVAVISHADIIKAAIAYYAGIPLDMFQRLEISPASVSIIELHHNFARILLVNDTGSVTI
jgi:probable phosphomutase (TIGR03848 family)